MDHQTANRLVLDVAKAFSKFGGDLDQTAEDLSQIGTSYSVALLRVQLLATAIGWALLKRMGVRSFPSSFRLRSDDGEETEVQVSDNHFFTTALTIAVGVFENGYSELFSREVVDLLCSESAEVDTLNRALNADPDLEVSEVELEPTTFHGFKPEDYDAAP